MSKKDLIFKPAPGKLSARWNGDDPPQLSDFHRLNVYERRAKIAKWGSWIAMFWYGLDLITDLYMGGDILGPLAAMSFLFYLFNKNKSRNITALPFRYDEYNLYVVYDREVIQLPWEDIRPSPFKIGDLAVGVPIDFYEKHSILGKNIQLPLYDMEYGITMDDTRNVLRLTKKGSPEGPPPIPIFKDTLKSIRDSDFSAFDRLIP
jgi:hypothetical protein